MANITELVKFLRGESHTSDYRHMVAANELERMASRLAKFEALEGKLGFCVDCGCMYQHYIDAPFASCGCKQSEWYDLTPYMQATAKIQEAFKKGEVKALKSLLSYTCPVSGPVICEHCRKIIEHNIADQ